MAQKQHRISKIDLFPSVMGLLGVALALLSAVNLSGHAQPLLDLNQKIVADLAAAGSLPPDEQMKELIRLRDLQDKALSSMPAEPFGWARYSYLRLATEKDKAGAFAALKLSNLVSPEEPRQIAERAIMWRQMEPVENADEKAYQTALWQKAFRLQPDQTLDIAKHRGITDEVGAAIQQGDPDEYGDWKSRLQN